ncbi:MAG: PAS domain S-box protein, partial [Opitutaceae bacterium]
MLKNVPIQRKLMMMILLTSGVVLLLTCSAFVTYELLILRQSSRQQLATLGRVIAANSIASLELGNAERAEEILRALEAEPHIVAAALYDEEGRLFATYPSSLDPAELPGGPAEDERDFAGSHLSRFQRVEESGKRFGSLYLRSNAGAMYGRFGLYGGVVALAVAVSIFVAYVLSRVLQHQISRPVLALASVAKTVSDRRDYSVRAAPAGRDELGLLTEAFNHMLEQIQKQNQVVSESEARVRAVLDSAISAAIVIDADGRVTDWNARAEAMFGWSRAEALGIGLAEMIIPEKYREVHRRGLKRFIDTGEGPYLRKLVELEALRRGRSPFPIELYISPLIDGNVISFCGFIRDLTEQKRTEEAVRAGQQLLAAVTENSTAVIYVKDVEGRYLLINRQFEQLFHVDRNSIVGKSDHDIFPREAADAFRAVDQQVLTAGRIIQTEETAPLDDGVHTYISVKCPLFDAAGKQYAMCGISTDITEHKRSQIRLQSQLGRLDL